MVRVDNSNKFTDRYRVSSSRRINWDYSTPGFYFVTICTLNHNNFFGKIINNQIELSQKGEVSKQYLLEIQKYFKNILIDEYVIMPNHIHLILRIINTDCRDAINRVSTKTKNISTKNKNTPDNKQKIFPNPMNNFSLSTVIRWYKAKCTFNLRHEQNLFFAWQPRYHDIIIKDEKQYFIIKNYIQNNVINWRKDKFYRL